MTWTELTDRAAAAFAAGGFVMPPLALISALLGHALMGRWLSLRRGLSGEVEAAVGASLEGPSAVDPAAHGVLPVALARARMAPPILGAAGLDEALRPLELSIHHGATRVRALVMVAPLLGLLGTVTGMIETFEALGDQALFARTGGIAGGVAQALVSTQAGLVVAIPGLVLGRLLDRMERARAAELRQVAELVLMRRGAT